MSELRNKILAGLSFGTPSIKITAEILSDFDTLTSRLTAVEKDLQDACIENGKIVDNSMKEVGRLKSDLTAAMKVVEVVKGLLVDVRQTLDNISDSTLHEWREVMLEDITNALAALNPKCGTCEGDKAPEEWEKITGVEIIDPDGWRNIKKDWADKITIDEFMELATPSTCKWPYDLIRGEREACLTCHGKKGD